MARAKAENHDWYDLGVRILDLWEGLIAWLNGELGLRWVGIRGDISRSLLGQSPRGAARDPTGWERGHGHSGHSVSLLLTYSGLSAVKTATRAPWRAVRNRKARDFENSGVHYPTPSLAQTQQTSNQPTNPATKHHEPPPNFLHMHHHTTKPNHRPSHTPLSPFHIPLFSVFSSPGTCYTQTAPTRAGRDTAPRRAP